MAKSSKISNFFRTLFVALLIAIIVITAAVNALFMKSSSAPFNNSIYIMQQTDMKDVQYGDAVISSASKVSELQAGNVVLCLTSYDNEYKKVLKLIDITQEDGTTYYYVKSDQESVDDALKLTGDKILAKCLWTNSTLGAIITFMKSTTGIATLIALPCLILLIMWIASTVAKQKEAQKEEESRKALNTNKKSKKRKNLNTSEIPVVKSDSDVKNSKTTSKKSHDDTPAVKHNSSINKPSNKQIPVKTLSEEESIKQRQNATNIIGSELESATIEIKNGIKEENVRISPANIDMVKIEEDSIIEENVHSPNMIAKASKIRQSLSNDDINDDIVPESKSTEITSVQESVPVTESTPVIEDTVSIEKPSVTNIDVDTPLIFNNDSYNTNIPKYERFKEEDFISEIIGDSQEQFTNVSKISDDVLDQLLDSIPSSVNTSKKSSIAVAERSSVKKITTKVTHRSAPKTNTKPKRHRTATKVKDTASFDELLQAIEKEKKGIK